METQTKDLMIFHPILVASYLVTVLGGGAWLHDLGYLLPAVTVAGMLGVVVATLLLFRMAKRDRSLGSAIVAAVFLPFGAIATYGLVALALEVVRHGF